MNCFADVQVNTVLQGRVLPRRNAAKHIGIVLSNGFALLETASIVEAFQSANEIADSAGHGAMRYNVSLLSAAGGRIASSSSVFVWTDSVEARGYANDFDALFIAGGAGVHHAVRDERLLTWLRRAYFRSELVLPIAEGLCLLEAAGFAHAIGVGPAGSQRGIDTTVSCHASSPLHTASSVIEDDLGADVVRKITACFEPPASTQFTAILRRQASRSVSEPIRVSAQWLEANGDQPVAIEAAAQIATMSERNFLRRFKAEMGVARRPATMGLCRVRGRLVDTGSAGGSTEMDRTPPPGRH